MFDESLLRPINGKYRSATAPLVEFYLSFLRLLKALLSSFLDSLIMGIIEHGENICRAKNSILNATKKTSKKF